jgi:uncharacterized protein (DUF2252 family)
MSSRPEARLDEQAAGLTAAQRANRGKAARRSVPRAAQAVFAPQAGRPDPVAQLEQQAASRVPELLPIRYGRMLASPLAYFRGAALPMASDLSGTPVTGLITQLCGDAHLSNFGIYASPERRLVFDINDFDETLPGPWEWDVKRLTASLEIAGRAGGFSARERRRIVTETAGHYRLAMRRLAGIGDLAVWYSSGDLDELTARYRAVLSPRERELAETDLGTGARRGSARTAAQGDDDMRALAPLVVWRDGRARLASEPPLLVPVGEMPAAESGGAAAQLHRLIAGYQATLEPHWRYLMSQFTVTGLARKVSGVGSVGMRCWIALLTGRDSHDLLFLQLKQAQPSVLSQFAGASRYPCQGERVVAGQRLMQASSDIFLGWHRAGTADYYVRQLRDWKFSVPTDAMLPATMRAYGALCGRTLARAHARSGDRIAIAAYLGSSTAFDTALGEFAAAYADQNDRDYAGFRAAVRSGRLPAVSAAAGSAD